MTTPINDLLAAATPLPWFAVEDGEVCAEDSDYGCHMVARCQDNDKYDEDAALIVTMVNAAPLVLEYMSHKHHYACSLGCNCGYSALARALGVDGE